MDAAAIFRQGLGSVIPRPPQNFYPKRPAIPHHQRDNVDDEDGPSHRIAHTLTACCRCRQRKTRCDPTLPRCLPCERSGSVCEYFDTTKGKKISRFYVVKLQDKVRQLEAELAQYTEDDNEYPRNNEDMVRPGGMVRLNETDETPRYLGPSSGIAMTRLLMEEAKRYTESTRISELVPDVRARRIDRSNRMQSVVSMRGSISGLASRKKSYPMISAVSAQSLPTRGVMDRLVEVFNQRAQVFTPTLHEKTFASDLEAVYDGDQDAYKNFVVRMVIAISLQKLDSHWSGLADSYHLAAMQYIEEVIRPKDLKTLQCLILIGQYSLLTPIRSAVYYIIGLTTRICQQLGLGEEKTISSGFSVGLVDPLTLDMRRRLSWIVTTMEFGLAHSMGRPNGFSKTDDFMDVNLFEAVDDELITAEGVKAGPPSPKKLVAIHFCKMRLCQAEIRRVLYEKARPEPRQENHPWFGQMQQRMKEWLDTAPEQPDWCKPWFTGRYHSMVIFLYRPSPQIPRPTPQAALRCFDSATFIINLSSQQVKRAAVDITWVFLLTLCMSLNAILWSVAYPDVRSAHSREEVEELVSVSLDIIDQCSERWPGTQEASQLYSVFAKACLQSYDAKAEPHPPRLGAAPGGSAFNTPPSLVDTSSPSASDTSVPASISSQPPQQMFNVPQFGYVFDAAAEQMTAPFHFDADASGPFSNRQPYFRSNSIFQSPGSGDSGRRPSYFPPDYVQSTESTLLPDQPGEPGEKAQSPPVNSHTSPAPMLPYGSHVSPPAPAGGPFGSSQELPTPPDSMVTPPATNASSSLSPALTATGMKASSPTPTPTMPYATPATYASVQQSPALAASLKFESDVTTSSPSPPTPLGLQAIHLKQSPPLMGGAQRAPPSFTIPPLPQPSMQQRPLPAATTVTDWFNPPPPFISPYAFSNGMSGNFWGDTTGASYAGLGLGMPGSFGLPPGREKLNGQAVAPYGAPHSGDGGGLGIVSTAQNGIPQQYSFAAERQGSLSQEQQMELMDVLESEGMGEIDAFLSMDIGMDLRGGALDGSAEPQTSWRS